MSPSSPLQFIPFSVVMRARGCVRTRSGWALPAPPPRRRLPEDHHLSKRDAWFNESEILRIADETAKVEENAFYATLSPWEWREVSIFRRGDFRSALAWVEWCEMIDAVRAPQSLPPTPTSTYKRSGVPEGRLMRLWRDYTNDPHLYFKSRAEQRVALDKLEYLLSFSRDSVVLKKATRQRNAVRVIERAVMAWQMKKRIDDEMEEMWDEFERLSVNSD